MNQNLTQTEPRETILSKIETVMSCYRSKTDLSPSVLVVLGSGLGDVVKALQHPTAIPYAELGLPVSHVEGHHGTWFAGTIDEVPVAMMQGRVHLYEGHSPHDVVLGVRAAIRLGVKTVVLTNAAGGVQAGFCAGDLMMITDHINLTGTSPLLGTNESELGPRFPDMSEVYSTRLRRTLMACAKDKKIALEAGVYAGLLGPSYETPAEIRMLKTMGADAVGMSTVLEAIAARHMDANVVGVSCITNTAAGIGSEKMNHQDVLAAAATAQKRLGELLISFIGEMKYA